MNYEENKKILDKIRDDYACAGEIIFRSALQVVIEHGTQYFNDIQNVEAQLNEVDRRHEKAETEGKILFMTRDFEKAIIECAAEISKITAYNLMIYIQREIWLGSGCYKEPDYHRTIELIENCMSAIEDRNSHYCTDSSECLDIFREIGFTDEELCYFGYEYLLEVEEE